MYQPDQPDYRRLLVAIVAASFLIVGWQIMVEWPRRQQLAALHAEQAKDLAKQQTEYAKTLHTPAKEATENPNLTRAERIALSPRVKISSDKLHGSISLKGARFDDLTLAKYRETQAPDSKEVSLFSPSGDVSTHFAQIGWVANDGKTKVPDGESLWKAAGDKLTPETPLTLTWDNGQNVTYRLVISLDANYMFSVNQTVENRSGSEINIVPYAFINRGYHQDHKANIILHEGPMGVVDKALKEIAYTDLKDKGNQEYEASSGWFGITDKYWLSALIPADDTFKTTYSYYQKSGIDRFQVDYVGAVKTVADGGSQETAIRLFAGAKEIDALDAYTVGDVNNKPIHLFDRSVDFGMLYFLTKPLFLLLNFFYKLVGNFGVAILLLTIVVKLVMFPLANKAYKATSAMRKLQPQMVALKEKHGDDRLTFQKELMSFYKREKINPAAGCLPLIIQMPVFFALYKVLFVTIEMRHAPFFGWLTDLSALDPSNIFTLFGILNWNPPALLHLGILPILMCATMVIQMRQQPTPTDPVQAKVLKYMPYFFLFILKAFPAGLVLYWTWSNTLSIIQQYVISKRHGSMK